MTTLAEVELAEMNVSKAEEVLRLAGHGERTRARRKLKEARAYALKVEGDIAREERGRKFDG